MPMQKTFDATEAEPRIYAAWDKAGAFAAGANAKQGAKTFCIMIPPPNVTGALHMGHAFNNTLQDILVRWHRMRGFDTLWQPGTDHAGIATQMVVERDLAETNRRRADFSRDEFVDLVWKQKRKSRSNIRKQLERLGSSCDWSREAFTMAGAPGDSGDTPGGQNFHDAVIRVFTDLYERGLIYRGKRLVNWDPRFETAISDLEVENIETQGHMWHFKYPLAGGATYEYVEKDADGKVTLRETRNYISIATTRPETMLGDGAVAVHPSDERYAPIIGRLCEIPVGPKEHRRLIPIITDEYPDPEFGSGAVKITGAHDFNDYEVAKRAGIPMYRLMDTRGHMRSDGDSYAKAAEVAQSVARGEAALGDAETDALNLVPDDLRGLDRFDARKRVVQQITAEGLAVTTRADNPLLGQAAADPGSEGAGESVPLVESKAIMQPYGDRSKVVIEPMLTDQWFVNAEKIVGPAIEAVRSGEVEILPEQDKKVYFNWLESIEPWCISRQLWWGHQVPVWYGFDLAGGEGEAESDELFECAPSFEEAALKFRERLGDLNITKAADKAEALKQAAGNDRIYPIWRDPDVLDTWFSSALWPIGTLGWPGETKELGTYFPTSVLITGFDIIFFWVARMIMMQYAVVGQKPFGTVYVHALVRDEKGRKMSKSLGNVIDPLELIDEFGADAVRFTLTAMAAMGRDLKLSSTRVQGYRNFTTKLWNAVRFAEMNGAYDADPPDPQDLELSQTANKWIRGEVARSREAVDDALGAYRFNDAANALYSFVWGKVCDWYLEFSKPLLASDNPEIVSETRATMAWVLDQCLILLHPIMPFITEELWGLTGGLKTAPRRRIVNAATKRPQGERAPRMLIHADWPAYGVSDFLDENADREMNWTIGLIEAVRSARAQVHVPAGLRIPVLQLELDAAGQAAWDRNEMLIKRLARIDSLSKTGKMPKGAITVPVEGGLFCLPLAEIIDVKEEKARLEKSLAKLEKEIGGLEGRLSNENFVASAPRELVEETREAAERKQEEAKKIKEALDRLAELA